MIVAKLDVTKIDKSKLYKGQKGTYLDITLIETPNSEYGQYMIVQSSTKEERAAGKKGTILGNAKILEKKTQGKPAARPASAPKSDDDGDSVPF